MGFGCSSFSWQTQDGLHLLGRTYDRFGDLAANRIISVPQGAPCAPALHREYEGAAGGYGYTGMAVLGFGEPILVDGINSAGLMGALLHYPEYAGYPDGAEPGKQTIHPGRLLAWLLSQCAGVRQAAEAMEHIVLVDEPIQGNPLPAHYILSDRTGETIVLEPDKGGLSIHRNTIGVLANSPGYLWHLTNLRNYVDVSNQPKGPRSVADYEICGFSGQQGCGFGLPGDYASPSRFVRLAFMKEFAVRGRGEVDGVSRMFRAFAPVDIPEGLAMAGPDGEEYNQTLCTSVMCAESGVYYFAPAWNRRISAVRLPEKGQETQYFTLGDSQDIDYRN